MNKNILVLGGSGFVGSKLLKTFKLASNVNVTSVSRKFVPQADRINGIEYVQGNCLNPETFEEHINQADSIVHTLGTLFESDFINQLRNKNNGSYEQMHLETAKKVGDLANQMTDKKRKFVYISANHYPPFLQKYMETKIAAENYLRTLEHLQVYSLRPGLITDQQQVYTVPLGIINNLVKIGRDQIESVVGGNQIAKDILSTFKVDQAVERRDLTKAIATICLKEEAFKEVNFYEDIKELSAKFSDLINLNQQ